MIYSRVTSDVSCCYQRAFLTIGGTVIQANWRSLSDGCEKWREVHVLSEPHPCFWVTETTNTSQDNISTMRISSHDTVRSFCCNWGLFGCLNGAGPDLMWAHIMKKYMKMLTFPSIIFQIHSSFPRFFFLLFIFSHGNINVQESWTFLLKDLHLQDSVDEAGCVY